MNFPIKKDKSTTWIAQTWNGSFQKNLSNIDEPMGYLNPNLPNVETKTHVEENFRSNQSIKPKTLKFAHDVESYNVATILLQHKRYFIYGKGS